MGDLWVKLSGNSVTSYGKKNWPSFIVMNCDHFDRLAWLWRKKIWKSPNELWKPNKRLKKKYNLWRIEATLESDHQLYKTDIIDATKQLHSSVRCEYCELWQSFTFLRHFSNGFFGWKWARAARCFSSRLLHCGLTFQLVDSSILIMRNFHWRISSWQELVGTEPQILGHPHNKAIIRPCDNLPKLVWTIWETKTQNWQYLKTWLSPWNAWLFWL